MGEIKLASSFILWRFNYIKRTWSYEKRNGKYKRGYGHTGKELSTIINLIDDLKEKHNVSLICKVLGVARSTYYAFKSKKPSNRSIENTKLKKEIQTIYDDSRGIYG